MRVQKFRHDKRELLEFDRLRHIRVEAGFHAFSVDVAQYIGRESDDGMATVSVLLFPASDLFAGLVAVFVRHV